MLKKYLHQLLFFMEVGLSWLSTSVGAPMLATTVDALSPLRSILYTIFMLIVWFVLLIAGVGVEKTILADAPLVDVAVIIVWGFLIAPVVAVVIMRLLAPKMTRSLKAQIAADNEQARIRRDQMKK